MNHIVDFHRVASSSSSSSLMARLIRQVNNEILPLPSFSIRYHESVVRISLFAVCRPGRRKEIKMGKNKGPPLCSLRPRFFRETLFFSLRSSNYNRVARVRSQRVYGHEKKIVKNERKRGLEKGGNHGCLLYSFPRFLSLQCLLLVRLILAI